MKRSRLYSFFYFALSIVSVILVLKMLNWVPLTLQQGTLRRYGDIEEARQKLNMKDLRVPSYFPQTISWPPAQVLGQATPYPAVLMVFELSGKQDHGLVISQAESDAFPDDSFIRMETISEKANYQLQGRQALLEVGRCGSREPCSRLRWVEGSYRITLTMKSQPFDLIRIAESMLH